MLGPAAGVIGSLQALEAMKLLTGVAPPITDGFLQLDLADGGVHARPPRATPRCPDCADSSIAADAGDRSFRRWRASCGATSPPPTTAIPPRAASRRCRSSPPGRACRRCWRTGSRTRCAHGRPAPRRLVALVTRSITNIEIHPRARIGEGLFIDHGTGVVIGETAEIGDNVTMYQGVTLGGTGFATGKRHPTVEDNVTIGSGAKLLGPITIGHGAKIGANSVVIHDVPPNSTVVGVPGHPVRIEGIRPEGPDADWAHLPDPVADAVKMLSARVAELEKRLADAEGTLHPPRSSRCATGAVPTPREARCAAREPVLSRAARRGVPVAARARQGPPVDDRARGLRAARPAAAAGRLADPPAPVRLRQQLVRARPSPSSTRRTARSCASRAPASRPRTSTRSPRRGTGRGDLGDRGGHDVVQGAAIAPMVQAKLQEKLDHDLARLKGAFGPPH